MSDLKDTALELAAAGLELANKRIRELEAEKNDLALKHYEQAATVGKLRDLLDECEKALYNAAIYRENADFTLINATLARLRGEPPAQEKANGVD